MRCASGFRPGACLQYTAGSSTPRRFCLYMIRWSRTLGRWIAWITVLPALHTHWHAVCLRYLNHRRIQIARLARLEGLVRGRGAPRARLRLAYNGIPRRLERLARARRARRHLARGDGEARDDARWEGRLAVPAAERRVEDLGAAAEARARGQRLVDARVHRDREHPVARLLLLQGQRQGGGGGAAGRTCVEAHQHLLACASPT